MNPAATQHHEGRVLRLHGWNRSHTIPAAPKKMMRNMCVLVTVSLLIVSKNHVENVSDVRVRSGTWYGSKVHRCRKHMGPQSRRVVDDTGSGTDIHHRGTTIAIIR